MKREDILKKLGSTDVANPARKEGVPTAATKAQADKAAAIKSAMKAKGGIAA
jgi:hypothetical protein